MKYLVITLSYLFVSFSFPAFSQVQRVNNDTISIDGQYAERTMTQSERLKNLRARLEKRTEMVVQKKIEQLRFQQELELSKKIQRAFNERMKALDNAFADDSETSSQL